MTTLPPMTRLRRSIAGGIAVVGIVLASAIGLHGWADDAVVSSAPQSVDRAADEGPGA
jgi:hypothetical protein